MSSDRAIVPVGFLVVVLLAGMGMFTGSLIGVDSSNGNGSDIESYPVGPEKPASLNSSNVMDYTVDHEERLLFNDLIASRNHGLDTDESVRADCNTHSASNVDTDGFRVRLECRGDITDTSRPSGSEEFTYSVTYHITDDTTQRTGPQRYPFGTDRGFNNERNYGTGS